MVDLVVLSHFHADHVAGLAGVLEGRTVAETRVSTVGEPEFMADQVIELASLRTSRCASYALVT